MEKHTVKTVGLSPAFPRVKSWEYEGMTFAEYLYAQNAHIYTAPIDHNDADLTNLELANHLRLRTEEQLKSIADMLNELETH